MPNPFISLLKEIGAIIGWATVWDYWESLKDSTWGKAVRAAIGTAIAATTVYVATHPILLYAVGTFILGWIGARVITLWASNRMSAIDWYALAFQLPTENSGIWLTGLTYPEPFVAFKFMVTNATKKPVEITGIKGIININGPCNAPARLTSFQMRGVKFRAEIETYEITIEQPVTAANASNVIETLKRSDGFVRFGFSDVQFTGTMTFDRKRVVPLQFCYVDRTSRGMIGMGVSVKGPIDLTSAEQQQEPLIKPSACFVSQRTYDADGRLRS